MPCASYQLLLQISKFKECEEIICYHQFSQCTSMRKRRYCLASSKCSPKLPRPQRFERNIRRSINMQDEGTSTKVCMPVICLYAMHIMAADGIYTVRRARGMLLVRVYARACKKMLCCFRMFFTDYFSFTVHLRNKTTDLKFSYQ